MSSSTVLPDKIINFLLYGFIKYFYLVYVYNQMVMMHNDSILSYQINKRRIKC
ncbi:hypothetical protein [Escherichia phage pEC-M719-6WT.2]|nr:hypothetical protein [Escherichia phage pEC-M719-6WT.2]